MSFRRVWSRFGGGRTLGPSPGAVEAWHQGRRWWHVVVVAVSDPAVRARREALDAAFHDVLSPFCADTPHVTLFVHGFVEAPERVAPHPAEGSLVDVDIGPVNAFSSCVFLEVRGAELRRLRGEASLVPEARTAAWRPHLTVGLFRRDQSAAPVAARLRAFRQLNPLSVRGVLQTGFVDALHPLRPLRLLGETPTLGTSSGEDEESPMGLADRPPS